MTTEIQWQFWWAFRFGDFPRFYLLLSLDNLIFRLHNYRGSWNFTFICIFIEFKVKNVDFSLIIDFGIESFKYLLQLVFIFTIAVRHTSQLIIDVHDKFGLDLRNHQLCKCLLISSGLTMRTRIQLTQITCWVLLAIDSNCCSLVAS